MSSLVKQELARVLLLAGFQACLGCLKLEQLIQEQPHLELGSPVQFKKVVTAPFLNLNFNLLKKFKQFCD